MVEIDLRNHLLSDVNISSLVQDRFYPLKADENCNTPFIVYSVVNKKDKTTLQGVNYEDEYRFQLDIYSDSYSEVKQLEGAVKNSMYECDYHPYNFTSRDLFEKDTNYYRQLIEFKIKSK